MMGNHWKRALFVLAIITLSACGKSEDKTTEKPGTGASIKNTAERQTGKGDPGLDGMVSGIVEQVAKQGVKIEASEQKEAVTQVIKLYLLRNDLQKAFGEPGDVDFTTMIKWAAVSGTTTDSDKDKLAAYATPMHSIAKQFGDAPVRVRLEWR
jgi:hypothetical protein